MNRNIIWSKESKNKASEGNELDSQRHDRTSYGGLYPRRGGEVPGDLKMMNTWTSCLIMAFETCIWDYNREFSGISYLSRGIY